MPLRQKLYIAFYIVSLGVIGFLVGYKATSSIHFSAAVLNGLGLVAILFLWHLAAASLPLLIHVFYRISGREKPEQFPEWLNSVVAGWMLTVFILGGAALLKPAFHGWQQIVAGHIN